MNEYRGRRWDHVDIELSCDEVGGNPFDLRLWAIFETEGQKSIRIPGFYRGEGRWTLRFMPTSPGRWKFVSESDVPELDGVSGRVMVEEARSVNHGRLRLHSEKPRFLRWEDGTPYFLIAFEADWLALLDVGDDGSEKARSLTDMMAANGFNHVIMNVYAHDAPWPGYLGRETKYDFSCPEIWPFGGTNDEPDHEMINPVYFDNLDRVVAYLREKGIVCHLMVYVWNKKVNWPNQGSAADRRFFDYVVARYQGFSNIVWDPSKEALTYGYCSADYIAGKCDRVRELDAYHHLLTVHDREFCEGHPELVDMISVQDWRSELYCLMMQIHDRYDDKLIFNIEHGGYEKSPFVMAPGDYQEPVACLERNYLCVFAGAYSTYYWQGCSWNIVCYDPMNLPPEKQPKLSYFRYMQELFARYPFDEFSPLPTGRVVSSGYALYDGGNTLLVLKPRDSYCIHLRGFDEVEALTVSWFNPTSGVFSEPVRLAKERFLPLRSCWNDVFTIACIELH